MRHVLLLYLAALAPAAAADLQTEDLTAIQSVFKTTDPSLDWFRPVEKKPIDARHAVLLVEAAPTELRPGIPKRIPTPGASKIGIFVVSGSANQVDLTVDIYAVGINGPFPTLERPSPHTIYLHSYSDYGMYGGSTKYIYDLAIGKPPVKIPYKMLAFTSAKRGDHGIAYSASYGDRHATVTIRPAGGDAVLFYEIADTLAPPYTAPQPFTFRTANGETARISNVTPPGQSHRESTINVAGREYPVPVPTVEQHRKLVPTDPTPLEIENNLGPFAIAGNKIWYANSFYDGEGTSGVGAIGEFDIATHSFHIAYLSQIVPWSGSAIFLDGSDLWIGLMRQPEGAAYGAGLLRYNVETRAVKEFPIKDYIHTLDRIGDTLYCGTSHGLYTIRNEKVTQLRFEPDENRKLAMVTRVIQ
jgi:hypothetical protein